MLSKSPEFTRLANGAPDFADILMLKHYGSQSGHSHDEQISRLRRRTDRSLGTMKFSSRSLFDWEIVAAAIRDSFRKLNANFAEAMAEGRDKAQAAAFHICLTALS